LSGRIRRTDTLDQLEEIAAWGAAPEADVEAEAV